MKLDKANLVSIHRYPVGLRPWYSRYANCASLRWFGFEVTWRMPWLKEAVYQKGWDAGWRATRSGKTEGPDYKKKYFDLLTEVDKAWGAFPEGTHAPTLAEGIQSLVAKAEAMRKERNEAWEKRNAAFEKIEAMEAVVDLAREIYENIKDEDDYSVKTRLRAVLDALDK